METVIELAIGVVLFVVLYRAITGNLPWVRK